MKNNSHSQVIFNFHGIGTPSRNYESGEEPYWISEELFESALRVFSENKLEKRILLTFDDGNASDVEQALPRLKHYGFTGQFFVLTGKLNSQGYLTDSDLLTLQNEGMKIGTHGKDHVDWTSLSSVDLLAEVDATRDRLQELTGNPVNAVAIPFGRYNRRVLHKLRVASFQTVYTSDGGDSNPSHWLQPRITIRNDTSIKEIQYYILSKTKFYQKMTRKAKFIIKSLR